MSKWSGITKWSDQVFDVELWWETDGAGQSLSPFQVKEMQVPRLKSPQEPF